METNTPCVGALEGGGRCPSDEPEPKSGNSYSGGKYSDMQNKTAILLLKKSLKTEQTRSGN